MFLRGGRWCGEALNETHPEGHVSKGSAHDPAGPDPGPASHKTAGVSNY